jgi:hypothetical protein
VHADAWGLLALKKFFTMLDEFTVTYSEDMSQTLDRTIHAAPTLVGLGGGDTMTNNTKSNYAAAGTVRPVLVNFISFLEMLIKSCQHDTIPVIQDGIDAVLNNAMDLEHFKCLVSVHGGVYNEWLNVLAARRERLSTEQLIEFSRRNGQTNEETRLILENFGWLRSEEATARLQLFDSLPTISEHLHWLQRNVFDDSYVHDYDLLHGFEERFWTKFGTQLYAQGFTKDRAALHYAAHWINPAPGQLAEMMIRNRPGRVPDNVVFKQEDYLRILAEQDVAPYFRERFLAIAYNVIPIRYLRQIYQMRQISDDDVIERLQDQGYKHADAIIFQRAEALQRERTNASRAHGFTPARLSQYYALGLIDANTVTDNMRRQGYDDRETADLLQVAGLELQARITSYSVTRATTTAVAGVITAYEIGTIDRSAAAEALAGIGWDTAQIEPELTAMDVKAVAAQAKEAISSLRRSVLGGEITIADARTALGTLGITDARTNEYLALWDFKLRTSHKQIAGSKIVSLVGKGLLSAEIARARLVNLGYTNPDAVLLLAQAEQDIAHQEAKAIASQEREGAKQAKTIEHAISLSEKSKARLQHQLCRTTPVGTLKRWFARYLIGENYFLSRLKFCGYTDDVAHKFLQEAEQMRELESASKQDQYKATAADVGAPSNGPPAGP